MTMADDSVELHEVVKDIASRLTLDAEGRLVMSDGEYARNRAKLLQLRTPDEKKAVVVGLVALVSRLVRENKDGTQQAAAKLADLAAGVIGDPAKAKEIFGQVTGAPKPAVQKPSAKPKK